jgi:hypothetical protein
MYANASMRKLYNSKNVLIIEAKSVLAHLSASFDQLHPRHEAREATGYGQKPAEWPLKPCWKRIISSPLLHKAKTLEQKTELRILKLRLNPLLDKV